MDPTRLLRDPFGALTKTERELLTRELAHVPDVPMVRHNDVWVGHFGHTQEPLHVVSGVCQGKNPAEKRLWLQHGPNVETIVGLDLAHQIALYYQATFHVWIVDQEYANVAAADQHAQQLEIEVGASVVERVRCRYPSAVLHRTSDAATRAELYARFSATSVSRLYAKGPQKPYGIASPTLWDQLDYLSCVGAFLVPGAPDDNVLGVVDHDQLRAVAAAHALRPSVAGHLYWPAPQLHWVRPATTDPNGYLRKLRTRRMHRADCVGAKLFLDDSVDEVRARSRCGCEGGVSHDALAELARMIPSIDVVGDTDKLLDRCLRRLRERMTP